MRGGAGGPQDRRLRPEQDDTAQREDGQRMRYTIICRSRGVDHARVWKGSGSMECRCDHVLTALWEIAVRRRGP